MIIKPYEYKTCECCGTRKCVSLEVRGCDLCGKEFDENALVLQATVFALEDMNNAYNLDFCSWECCLRKLKTVSCDHFISLPYLHYEPEEKGVRAKDFFNCLNPAVFGIVKGD